MARDALREAEGRKVLVQLDDGTAIDGTLARVTPASLVLDDATAYADGKPPLPMDGSIYLNRFAVTFVQAPR